MPRQLRVLLGLSLAVALPIVCQAQVLPRPTYDNSVHIGYICWDDCLSTDAIVSAKAADLQQRIGSGPYPTLGLEELIAIDMPWNANLSSPVLSSPLDGDLRAVLDRLKTNGLTLHLSVLAGVHEGKQHLCARCRRGPAQCAMVPRRRDGPRNAVSVRS